MVCKGQGSLHVTGFFEPDNEPDMPYGEDDLEDVDEEDESED